MPDGIQRYVRTKAQRMGQLNRFLLEFRALQKQLYRALSVFTCGVQRNQDDAGDATEHKKRLGREAESSTAQQLKRKRVELGDVTCISFRFTLINSANRFHYKVHLKAAGLLCFGLLVLRILECFVLQLHWAKLIQQQDFCLVQIQLRILECFVLQLHWAKHIQQQP
ncbi:hypothetical protein DAPPUDRAFT_260387 [Daphnia pulex]|uniref:Uncharacterized protein n=1 Tax=Daphnia pulex TaxID=6669 RepID=E9HJ27_DAPPU|nr:hypothetical protein DAPPUDRAFT_260387 [Daphnia pulex]|eukprot:EFX68246.1 hypothetical protein DAPPUDRAFT_260387 [Daphnia pulex]